MTLIEFIGLIVGLIGMVFLVLKQLWQDSRSRLHSESGSHQAGQRRDEESLRFLDHDNDEEEDQEEASRYPLAPPPIPVQAQRRLPPPPVPASRQPDKSRFHTPLEGHRQKSAIEAHSTFLKAEKSAYAIVDRKRPSRASQIIRDLPTLKNMVVIKEILGPPKGLFINNLDD